MQCNAMLIKLIIFSAINPIIYGFFNENFNKEFMQLFSKVIKILLREINIPY